ncbi:hypothetical protein KIW84_030741 [Lathyrus oleraceus]|uniref:Uncharacterized protein n=1 Tax=Pisum sativum TaxID=3888 RepID=A0A9D4XPA2_PEA|nr:hypothetical protein KIW84_030741 [Pisum sativum]
MRRLLHPVYRGDPESERTLRVLRRFQLIGHFPGSPTSCILADVPELEIDGELELDEEEAEVVMAYNDVIGISNDRARNIIDYTIFDPNAMNTRIIRPKIDIPHSKFKPMMFQILQTIGHWNGIIHKNLLKSNNMLEKELGKLGKEDVQHGGIISGPLCKSYIPEEPVEVLELSAELKKHSLSSVEVPPELKLKQLPAHLQYAYLEVGQKLPIIVAIDLSAEKKGYLLSIL